MSHSQRNITEQAWQIEKENKTLQRLVTKGLELKKQGKSWREIYHGLHLARYKDLEATIKQKLGF